MATFGVRSVEVFCINDTRGNLTVEGPGLGSESSWIQGMQANSGALLGQYESASLGVFTNAIDSPVSGHFQLVGLGSYPVTLEFQNLVTGQTSCQVTGNNAVAFIVTQVDTDENNHSSFTVLMIPTTTARWAAP